MYKCLDCGRLFEEPKEYVDADDDGRQYIWKGCPDRECKSGAYVRAYKCSICEEYKPGADIYHDICYECAEKEYTDRLGVKYLESHRESYLDFYGVEQVDRDLKNDLIDVLENDFLSKLDFDSDWNHKLKYLKEYILDDIDLWIDFLKEEM